MIWSAMVLMLKYADAVAGGMQSVKHYIVAKSFGGF